MWLRLVPHPAERVPPDLELQVRLSRSAAGLSVRYLLHDPLNRVLLPEAAPRPERRDGLWKTTCFELFLARPDEATYHELNLSPAGHWNLLHFRERRQPAASGWMPAQLACRCQRPATGLGLSVDLPLEPLGLAVGPLHLGVCAVLETHRGELSHWALAHLAERPDFHLPAGFVVALPPFGQEEAEL